MTDSRTVLGHRVRQRLTVRGTVQGVGFRPFVHRLATDLGLVGSVHNDGDGVTIEVEGTDHAVKQFSHRLTADLPPLASIIELSTENLSPVGDSSFVIAMTDRSHVAETFIPPDIATCPDCLADISDRSNRRFRYPFTNCTNCGPRYTIVEQIPYDRPFTSMRQFRMCPDCEREYHDPADRRFHAQPNACPMCGPSLALYTAAGKLEQTDDPIEAVAGLLKAGRIVAIKGIGGFHLAVDPLNESAVAELRRRKGRAEKPFALMAKSIEVIQRYCEVSVDELGMLENYRRPIVLLQAKSNIPIAPSVAPAQKYLGIMLPYTPFHRLLFDCGLDVLVMTSANLAEEPIVIDNDEAFDRLNDLADYILVHDRTIVERCDDSVVRSQDGFSQVIRRSRGYVPQPVLLKNPLRHSVLAVGAELKNVIAVGRREAVILSQHIGDMDNPSALRFFVHSIDHLQNVMQVRPDLVACDMHPEYLSTKWARGQREWPVIAVQHHHAHLVSVLADNGTTDSAIGIILDGTGFGTDGTIWGGEVLIGDARGFDRFAWLDPVPMPGGTAAIREPWRMAVSYLVHAFGDEATKIAQQRLHDIAPSQIATIQQMLAKSINTPQTSSCGRLFDGVAALLGLRSVITYDAQAAVELEMAAEYLTESHCGQELIGSGPIDVGPLIQDVVRQQMSGVAQSRIAGAFHAGVAELFARAAIAARDKSSINRVALGGGVFHNALLLRLLCDRLKGAEFEILLARQVPPNDGGLALGQAVIADVQYNG